MLLHWRKNKTKRANLRNHAPRSYTTWLPVTLTWLLNNLQVWRHRRGFRKLTVRIQPIRKEIVSSMYNNNYNSDLIFTGAWSSTFDDTVRCDAWGDDKLLSSGIFCKKHSTPASSGQSEKEESQTKVKEFRHILYSYVGCIKIDGLVPGKCTLVGSWPITKPERIQYFHCVLYIWIVQGGEGGGLCRWGVAWLASRPPLLEIWKRKRWWILRNTLLRYRLYLIRILQLI